MISSTVVPLGGVLSSGPSCARAIDGVIRTRAPSATTMESQKRDAGSAGRERNLITSILTKAEWESLTAASTSKAVRANGSFVGGGRLQFCLFPSMQPSRQDRKSTRLNSS